MRGKTTFEIELLLNEEKVLEQASAAPDAIPADESGG